MLANGAEGVALDELTSVLGAQKSDLAALNSLAAKLLHQLPQRDSWVELSICNSIWAKPSLDFSPSYSNSMSENFNAENLKADFSTIDGISSVNNWISKATKGLIGNMFDEPVNVQFMLVNALYFNGKWAEPFKVANTKNETFTLADGSTQTVEMMHCYSIFSLKAADDFLILKIPYGNEAFSMKIILPTEGNDIMQIAKTITAEKFRQITNSNAYDVAGLATEIGLPRFSVSSKFMLSSTLKSMGLTNALSASNQYGNFFADGVSRPVGGVYTSAYIKVDENGSVAAAATATGNLTANRPIPTKLIVDRPFMFIIDEASTGSILFMGIVNSIN